VLIADQYPGATRLRTRAKRGFNGSIEFLLSVNDLSRDAPEKFVADDP
jgi:hypothetical protein